jgi:hypothetical protein
MKWFSAWRPSEWLATHLKAVLGTIVMVGMVLIVLGSFVEDYAQSALLEVGAAFLLAAPLLGLERLVDDALKRNEDTNAAVGESVLTALLAQGADEPGARDVVQTAQAYEHEVKEALSRVAPIVSETARDGGLDAVASDGEGHAVGVEVKSLANPVSSGTMATVIGRAEQLGHPVLLVTRSQLTRQAAELARTHPDVNHVVWQTPGDDTSLRAAFEGLADMA